MPGNSDGELDVAAMIQRFANRAEAVKGRGIPPIEGPERQRFIAQSKLDFMDFAILADADGSLEDGILVLRVDLRPASPQEPNPPPEGSDTPSA